MAELSQAEEKLQNDVGCILKSLLTSFGGELAMNKIDAEYKTVVGNNIPYRQLKHATLASFLQSIPKYLTLKNRGGQLIAAVVQDKDIGLILRQVQEQNQKQNKVARKNKAAYPPRNLHGSTTLHHHHTRWPNNPVARYALPWRPDITPVRPKQHQLLLNAYPQQNQKSLLGPRPMNTEIPRNNPIQKLQPAQPQHHPKPLITQDKQKPLAVGCGDQQSINAGSIVNEKPVKKTYMQQLEEAVRKLGDDSLELKLNTFICGKKPHQSWYSLVCLGDIKVSSYPDQMSSKQAAEEAVSQKALKQVNDLAKKRQAQLPTTTSYNVSIPRVKQLLKERSHNKRFWWEAVSEMYCEAYKEQLPKDWIHTLKKKDNQDFVFANPCSDKWTVGLLDEIRCSTPPPQIQPKAEPQSPEPVQRQDKTLLVIKREGEDNRKGSPSPQERKPQLPPISLPSSPTWDVFIMCMEDFNTIHLRLVGEEYSNAYSELLTEMELHYMEEKNQCPVKEPVVGEIYTANHEESWFRVELLEVLGDVVRVKFVDHGDWEFISLSDLHHLKAEFFALPAQALCCCLAGLEDIPFEASQSTMIENLPMGKTLVARVQRRQQPYALVLFDTSTNDDVNLNEKVLESLTMDFVEPTLPSVGGLAEVYLTHSTSNGDLYIQVESKTYRILEDLLKMAKRRTEEMLGEKVLIDLTKLYLARFSEDGEWYRAVPRSNIDPEGKVLVKFVDFGNSDRVPLSSIRCLESVSPLLAKVPHQALLCRLHNVPVNPELRWTVQACRRLLDLATQDSPLLLKVVSEGSQGKPPLVQLFKRLLPQNELVSINDTLGIDSTLFCSEGDSNNNSVEKEVVLSQFRSQQSSCVQGARSSTGSPRASLSPRPGGEQGDASPLCPTLSLSDIPDVDSYFDVFVTFAASPYHFAVQPWKMSKEFNDLAENIQMFYQNSANLRPLFDIQSGEYYAVKHSDDVWYRAKVNMVLGETVAGVFVDYGDCFVSRVEKVQPLSPGFCLMPCLAIKAKLHGIMAANKDWSPEDTCRFRELVGSKNLVSMVYGKEVQDDGTLLLSLLLIDTSDKLVDTYINQILIDENRAVWADL